MGRIKQLLRRMAASFIVKMLRHKRIKQEVEKREEKAAPKSKNYFQEEETVPKNRENFQGRAGASEEVGEWTYAMKAQEEREKEEERKYPGILEKKMKQYQEKLEKEKLMEKKMKQYQEELEKEKRSRIEGERRRRNEVQHLMQQGLKIFFNLLRHQRRRPPPRCAKHNCRCRNCTNKKQREGFHYQTSEYHDDQLQRHSERLAPFDLSEEFSDAEDLLNMFNSSLLLLEDNPADHSFDVGESSEHLNSANYMALTELSEQLPDDFEDDILRTLMTTVNDHSLDDAESSDDYPNYENVLALLEYPDQLSDDGFEDEVFSSVMTTIDHDDYEVHYMDDDEVPHCANEFEPSEQRPYRFEDDIVSPPLTTIKDGTQAKEEGNAYFKDQKFAEAIKCYTVSIHESPTTAAYGNRAMAYFKLSKFIEAENDCSEALKIDDSYFKAYARRAMARTKQGRNLKGALKDVEVALKLEPNSQEMQDLRDELILVLG